MQKLNNTKIKIFKASETKNNKTLLESVIAIWQEAFGDEESYILNFLEKYNGAFVVVLFEDFIAKSMLFLLPTALKTKDKEHSGFYVYAVATKKESQGKGFAKILLNFVNEEFLSETKKDFTFLVPSEKSLFSFYEKTGYKMGGMVNKGEILVNGKSFHNFTVEKLTEKSYFDFRKSALKNTAHISWGENHLSYAVLENEFLGGESFLIEDESQSQICAFVSLKENNALILREIVFLNEENKDKVTEFLGFKFKVDKLIYKSNISLSEFDREDFGMIFSKNKELTGKEDFYIGLPLD